MGYPLPHPTIGGLGERRELPQRSPSQKGIWYICYRTLLVEKHNVFMDNYSYTNELTILSIS